MSANRLGIVYQQLRQRFKQAGSVEAGLKAHLLLEWAAGATYRDVVVDPDRQLDGETLARLEEGLNRLLRGESIHRIRGVREFYGLNFSLSPETLEPRPDSEALIDLVLPLLKALAEKQQRIRLLDMGTGSGILAITLLAHVPQLHAVGVDIAAGALAMAAHNAHRNGVGERFQPLVGDWFANVTGKYDFIIANPPYIPRADIAKLDRTVRDFDPLIALDGGVDGLDFYRKLAVGSGQFLVHSGKIAVEIGQGQEEQVTNLFARHGFQLSAQADDLSGLRRVLSFTF